MLRGVFVTGTGTGVGKTIVCAALMRGLRARGVAPGVRYWKPIQTGIERDDDTKTVRRLSRCGATGVLERGIRFPRPLSPHLSARLAGQTIDAEALLQIAAAQPASPGWLVEGAGGVLVPVNDDLLMIDLIARLALPALIAARSTLGTINHTLLTVEALRRRSIATAGVVMVGPANRENRAAIERYGAVEVLAELPLLRPLTAATIGRWASSESESLKRVSRWFR